MNITAAKAYYIKLGKGGDWEEKCLFHDQILQASFSRLPDEYIKPECKVEAKKHLSKIEGMNPGVATRYYDQALVFLTAGEDVLWITMHQGSLYWCFSKREVFSIENKRVVRPVIGKWTNKDIKNRTLEITRLSGRLTSIQGFRGALCNVKELEYILAKINGEKTHRELVIQAAQRNLLDSVENAVQNLHWHDFEVLVDLIFRQSGWKRISDMGGKQKTVDLILGQDITGDRLVVQVKSGANKEDYDKFVQDTGKWEGNPRFYFIVHSPKPGLSSAIESQDRPIWFAKEIAKQAVKAGLADWLAEKAV